MSGQSDFTLPHHFDATMRVAFASCPQKFRLEFGHGFRPPGRSIDLHAGGCFASAIERVRRSVWVDGNDLQTALRRTLPHFLTEWGDFESVKKTAKTKDNVWFAVEQYFERWDPRTDHIQPYELHDGRPSLEYSFAIPLVDPTFPTHPDGSPFVYCGRFDLLGKYECRPVIEDDKTAGQSAGAYWTEKWNLRSQFMGYVWACRQLGLDLDTCVVRGIGILMTKIDLAEAIIPFGQHQIARWYEQLRHDLWRLRRAWDEGYFDYNFGDTCTSYGNCMFMDVCRSPTPESWYSNFEVNKWNPIAGTVENEVLS
jgi:hypothetical protein